MEILKREESAYPINEEDCKQQEIADMDTGPVSKAEIKREIKKKTLTMVKPLVKIR